MLGHLIWNKNAPAFIAFMLTEKVLRATSFSAKLASFARGQTLLDVWIVATLVLPVTGQRPCGAAQRVGEARLTTSAAVRSTGYRTAPGSNIFTFWLAPKVSSIAKPFMCRLTLLSCFRITPIEFARIAFGELLDT